MGIFGFIKSKHNVDYFSFGIDCSDDVEYYYLQTSNKNNEEDFEIVYSRYKIIPFVVGLILSKIYNKRLVKWWNI